MAFLRERPRCCSPLRWAVWGAILLLGIPASLCPAEAGGYSEYEVKAAILYKFAKFVEWPDEAKLLKRAPLLVGVLGEDPFNSALEDAFKGKTVRGRRLEIRRSEKASDLKECHIVFICAAERDRLSKILEDFKELSVLTVGETDKMAEKGGIINLQMEGRRIRFEVNVGAAKRAKLKISSQLLKLAKIVDDENGDEPDAERKKG